jgi:CMP-N-acetylneuraminic acid synthetase
MNVVALIPARGGSKGIPHKNILDLGGFPLIAYSIVAAKLSKSINRVIVSTDSRKIAEVALKYGAEVPFLRPKKYAGPKSTDLEFVQHALKWFQKKEKLVPDYLVQLRPTTPLRDPKKIDDAVRLILKNPDATSLRSGYELRESPYKFLKLDKGYFKGLFPNDPRPEYYNLPRQAFSPVYQPNGYVDILVTNSILKSKTLHGKRILGFVTEDVGELDKADDIEKIEYLLKKKKFVIYNYLRKNFKK